MKDKCNHDLYHVVSRYGDYWKCSLCKEQFTIGDKELLDFWKKDPIEYKQRFNRSYFKFGTPEAFRFDESFESTKRAFIKMIEAKERELSQELINLGWTPPPYWEDNEPVAPGESRDSKTIQLKISDFVMEKLWEIPKKERFFKVLITLPIKPNYLYTPKSANLNQVLITFEFSYMRNDGVEVWVANRIEELNGRKSS